MVNSVSYILFRFNLISHVRYKNRREYLQQSSLRFYKRGTRTVAPVSTVAGLVVLVAVSPFKPGSV